MCGIAGIVGLRNQTVFESEIRAMCEAMWHRGPNGEGLYIAPGVGLGMRRLSIIDLETGQQPIGNEDGSVWVVLNGEIYNFRALRRELRKRGHVFSTRTDTEVIVHLYEDFGAGCIDHLRGMFAFAVWDIRHRQLLLARDRLGIKPLYYARIGDRLLFASELKAILALGEVERRLNWNAVARVFAFLASPSRESVIDGVHKLEPGHVLTAGPGRAIQTERYWQVRFEPDETHGERYFVERLRELLREAVDLHTISDVPLGAFLSGGLDSSAIVAVMARLAKRPVRTFSIGFADRDYDERPHARRVAGHFGTDHRELLVEPADLHVIEDVVWHLDEPFGDSSAVPTYMVSKLAAEHVTVAMSGDGGDELFAGYDRYCVEERERQFRPLPSFVRKALGLSARMIPDGMRGRNFVRHLSLGDRERFVDAATLYRRDDQARLFSADVRALLAGSDPWNEECALLTASETGGDWLSALQRLDLSSYLPLDILTKVDRMSMAHSLEVRPALLDHKLVEFAATIPSRLRLRQGRTKHILKEAMRGVLPRETIDRPKHGFSAPFDRWFKGSLSDFAHDLLLSQRCRERGIFQPRYVEARLNRRRHRRECDFFLWTLIVFEQWCRLVIDRPSAAGGSPAIGPPVRERRRSLVRRDVETAERIVRPLA